jgi:hypothetical protein
MHTFTINATVLTLSFRHVSALKGPSSRSKTDTFQQQGQQNELPDTDSAVEIYLSYSLKMVL